MGNNWELALLLQQGLIALSSGFNVFHFLSYYSSKRGRRWGAKALVLVNLAFLVQSLYLGLLPFLIAMEGVSLLLNSRFRFIVGILPLSASAMITIFVIRWRRSKRHYRG